MENTTTLHADIWSPKLKNYMKATRVELNAFPSLGHFTVETWLPNGQRVEVYIDKATVDELMRGPDKSHNALYLRDGQLVKA